MKKILLVLFLFPAIAQSQINFPDSVFKAILLSASASNQIATNLEGAYFKIDANNDGEIQQSEALQVKTLIVPGQSINSIEGIGNFQNLQYLSCEGNLLTEVHLNGLSQLNFLDVGQNIIETLELTNLPALHTVYAPNNNISDVAVSNSGEFMELYLDYNEITAIDVSGLVNLQKLWLPYNPLSSINLAGATGLEHLEISYCSGVIANLDASSCTALEFFEAMYTNIQHLNFSGCIGLASLDNRENSSLESLNIDGCSNLGSLNISQAGLTTLDLHGFESLYNVTCSGLSLQTVNVSDCPLLFRLDLAESIQLQSVVLSNLPDLEYLYAHDCSTLSEVSFTNTPAIKFLGLMFCNLSEIDLTGLPALDTFHGSDNQLSTIDFSENHNLTYLNLSGNQLTTVDVSACHHLSSFLVHENQLTSVFMKNGANETANLFDNPGLSYVCADESQIQALLSNTTLMNQNPDLVVNSYCAFTPGGDYNTISGAVRIDADVNGCSTLDAPMPFLKMKINDGTADGIVVTNPNGEYAFYTEAGNFTLSPLFELPAYFTASPASAAISFANDDNNTTPQNFCITPNGFHPDIEITLAPVDPARPGFDASYSLVLRNKGNQTLSGDVVMNFEGDVLDFVSASQDPSSQTENSLVWNYANLQPFEPRTFYVTLNVNGPMETPPVNNADVLDFTVVANPIAGDELPSDNTFALNQIVVGSYDPNDKHCLEGSIVSPDKIGEYLHYIINFENTGTFPAENVVVADLIDATKFDVSTFQMLSASHPVVAKITGTKAEFIFEGIDLGINEHGHVIFKVKTKNTLPVGTTVTNIANIFFDYNFPIETNAANTTFQALGAGDVSQDKSVTVSPNPVSGKLHVRAGSAIQSVQIYDVHGRLVSVQLPQLDSATVEMSASKTGVYFVKVLTSNGVSVQKVMKN